MIQYKGQGKRVLSGGLGGLYITMGAAEWEALASSQHSAASRGVPRSATDLGCTQGLVHSSA
jgi:hypothetical protein